MVLLPPPELTTHPEGDADRDGRRSGALKKALLPFLLPWWISHAGRVASHASGQRGAVRRRLKAIASLGNQAGDRIPCTDPLITQLPTHTGARQWQQELVPSFLLGSMFQTCLQFVTGPLPRTSTQTWYNTCGCVSWWAPSPTLPGGQSLLFGHGPGHGSGSRVRHASSLRLTNCD